MALTDESTNGGMVMPVTPMGGNNNGFGFGDGNGFWFLILFFLLCGNGWNNGFGGNGLANDAAVMYPWMNQSNQISGGFRDQMLNTSINGIQQSITSGFGDVQNALCGGFAGVNASINGAQNAIAQQLYTNQISDLERSFAAQTAQTAGVSALQAQLAQCCCDNRAATADLKYTVASEACSDRNALSQALANVTAQNNANTQRILDQLCADKIEQKNDIISQLRSELMYARGQASQDVQTAAIQAGQRALANEVEQYVAPSPRPAYIVQNPNCCAQNFGCGCGVA